MRTNPQEGMPAAGNGRLLPAILLLAVGALLGVSTTLAKAADEVGLPPLALLTWSVVGAMLLISAVSAARGRLPRVARRTGEYFVVAALVGAAGPNLIMYAAVREVGAGFVALTLALPPLLTYAGSLALRLESFAPRRAGGVLLALGGAAYLAYQRFALPDAPVGWIAASLAAPAILAVGNIYRTVRWPRGMAPDQLVPGVLAAASVLIVAAVVAADVPLQVRRDDMRALALIALQTAVLSVQYLLFFVLQRRGGPVLLSLLGSVAAVVGVPMAVLLLGEAPPAGLGYGAPAIAVGVFLVALGGGGPRKARGSAAAARDTGGRTIAAARERIVQRRPRIRPAAGGRKPSPGMALTGARHPWHGSFLVAATDNATATGEPPCASSPSP